jgi:HK97 family phage major capsid protein
MKNLLYRSTSFERTNINEDERTVQLSFSSETPVLRNNHFEVLSHRANDINKSFLDDNRAPLLLDHDHKKQIGVVRSVEFVDGVGRATVQFSRSSHAQEIFQDVIDGIRANVSVGYALGDKTIEKQRIDDVSVYRYQWTPFEISILSGIPADMSIGVGRSSEEPTIINLTQKEKSTMENQKTTLENVTAEIDTAIESAAREAVITTASRAANPADVIALTTKYGLTDQAEELVRSQKTLDEVKAAVLDTWAAKAKEQRFQAVAPAVHTAGERSYSIGKAIRAAVDGNWNDAGFEREYCQEMGKTAGRGWTNNTFYIDPNATRAAVSPANSAGGAGYGADLIGTTYMPERLIDALWNKTWLSQVGTDSMLGLIGNASFPVINSNATSTFVGETADLPAAQALGTALKTVSPKELVSKFAYSRQLMIQGLPNIEAKVIDQLYRSIAQKLDAVALSNSGVTLSTTGLLNEITQVIAMGTNGAIPSLAAFWDMQKALINSKTLQGDLAYVMSGSLYSTLHTTLKDSANTASGYILADGQETLAGYPVAWSQNVPNNLSKGTGTNLSAAIFGNFNDLLIAQWGPIAVEVDTITAADTSQIVVRSYSFWDMLVKRAESFAVVKDFKA